MGTIVDNAGSIFELSGSIDGSKFVIVTIGPDGVAKQAAVETRYAYDINEGSYLVERRFNDRWTMVESGRVIRKHFNR